MPECCGFFSSVQSRLSMTELLVHDFLSKYMCIPEHPERQHSNCMLLPACQSPGCCAFVLSSLHTCVPHSSPFIRSSRLASLGTAGADLGEMREEK